MKQTFLLQEVIDDIINIDKSLSASLMKLQYFAKLTKNPELLDYTQNELTGYPDKDNVPNYRKTIGILYIDIQALHNHYSGQLPLVLLDEKFRSAFEYLYIRDGIATIEQLAKENEKSNSGGQIFRHLPMELLHILQEPARKIYKSDVKIDVVGAKLVGNANIVVEIPIAIRAKLLDFVMSMADTFGYNIEIESFNKKSDINNQTIIHQMNTTIHTAGDGNVINTGDNNQINVSNTIQKGDLNAFQKRLEEIGVNPEEIEEISEIVQTEQPYGLNLGPKASGWIGKMVANVLSGASKIGIGAAGNLLATAVKLYLGIPG